MTSSIKKTRKKNPDQAHTSRIVSALQPESREVTDKQISELVLRSTARGVVNTLKTQQVIAHVLSSRNNTILTLTNASGDTKAWASCGSSGFKGARRKTSYAAQAAAEALGARCRELGYFQVSVRIRGFGPGRESAIRGLSNSGLQITRIQDCTPIPHNGCRPKKRTRG